MLDDRIGPSACSRWEEVKVIKDKHHVKRI